MLLRCVAVLLCCFLSLSSSAQEKWPTQTHTTIQLVNPKLFPSRSNNSETSEQKKQRDKRETEAKLREHEEQLRAENNERARLTQGNIIYRRAEISPLLRKREEESKRWDAEVKANLQALRAKYGEPLQDPEHSPVRAK